MNATLRFLAPLFMLLLFARMQVAALDAAPQNISISELVQRVREEREPLPRYELASNLPELVERDRSKAANPAVIDQLGSLLDDSNDGIRGFAASALGRIGAPAARVVPHLMQALKKGESEFIRPGVLRPSSFSGDQICQALSEIGMTPSDAHCKGGLYSY